MSIKSILLVAALGLIGTSVSASASDCKDSGSCPVPVVTSGATPEVTQEQQQSVKASPSATAGNEVSGSLINVQNNINSIGDYNFGPGISCATPGVAISAGVASEDVYTLSAQYVLPLGGSVGRNCEKLAREIVVQRQLDTSFTLMRQCIELARSGVIVDYKVFPELSKCASVTPKEPPAPVAPVAPVAPKEPPAPVAPKEPVAPVTPKEPVAPVTPKKPVRALW